MIVILDYGMGNANSILNMIRKVGGDAVVSIEKKMIEDATAIILPGVGSFDNGIEKLRKSAVLGVIERKVLEDKIPFLGICLGMQLLFESSEEGVLPGLGWINGEVKRFNFSDINAKNELKIPHMGWNVVTPKTYESLFSGLETEEARFYFVHSFHVNCALDENILAMANYGYKFTCSVQKDNIFGVQFHPEKSHRFGMTFFSNFLEMVEC